MGLFSGRRNTETRLGLHAGETGFAIARVSAGRARRPVLVASAFQADGGEIPGSREIGDLARGLEASGDPLNVVLSGNDYQLLLVEAPRVDSDELRSAVRWRVKDLIDFHIDDAVFDVFAVPGQQNRPRGQALMYAVAARAGKIRTLVDCIRQASLKLDVIDIRELAMRNLAALTEHDVRGIVMLQIEEAGGLLTISHQHELYMTRQLDLEAGEAGSSESELFEQLLLEIQRSIDYYSSHFAQPAPIALSILPGYERAAELAGWLNDQLDQNVEVFDVTRHMDCEAVPESDGIDLRLMAIGGALRREEVAL
ncbi:MAG: pilus assembly protein PilM [Wenzhouxiangellaceae bacterium]